MADTKSHDYSSIENIKVCAQINAYIKIKN